MQDFGGGFYGVPGAGGVKDAATGHITPSHGEIRDHDIQYEYRYTLILGELDEIRRYLYEHADRPTPPEYRFVNDRRHWRYENCRDTGWPIRDELHVLFDGENPRLIGPLGFWNTSQASTVRIRGAWRTADNRARIF